MIRSTVSAPDLFRRFDRFNRGKRYPNRIKPFSFLLSATVDPVDWPPEAGEAGNFRLIAPYSPHPRTWTCMKWVDLHSGREYPIRSRGSSNRAGIRVQTFRDVLERFHERPGAKSADADGQPAGPDTVGLLRRRHVVAAEVRHFGEETNLREQKEEGINPADPQAVYELHATSQDLGCWLRRVPLSDVSRVTGVPERRLRKCRAGEAQPRSGIRRSAILHSISQSCQN